ncbi:MAG: decarboxylating 6-phosphogluconate dehydrogenase [Dehalococcoidia bacterium]|nr:MAG: decarboxylating 6-phosphogluconate dehydrogenase [Dehalococcoidia bacterium]UCG83679.1 MAG: decarboxylating 6-phosphogluconate dehydrogenase [Dehalococcoidia bacterium]
MELGMIGMGRMGSNMARRLLEAGHRVVVYDPVPEAVMAVVAQGAVEATSAADLVSKIAAPRTVWLMVPAGDPTESAIASLAAELSSGDTIIDGGNSYYKDSMRRAAALADKGISFLDVGTSGGICGLAEGYCLMVGGDTGVFRHIEPIFKSLAPLPDRGYGHVGPCGSGHYVKMIHNGIEYGMMQAYAEGFELMQAKQEFGLNLYRIAEIWRYGSVIRSWLLDLTARALQDNPKLDGIQAYVEDSGEGRWTVQESVELGVPAPIITQSLQARFRSRQNQPFAARLLAALRNQFGGHAVKKAE